MDGCGWERLGGWGSGRSGRAFMVLRHRMGNEKATNITINWRMTLMTTCSESFWKNYQVHSWSAGFFPFEGCTIDEQICASKMTCEYIPPYNISLFLLIIAEKGKGAELPWSTGRDVDRTSQLLHFCFLLGLLLGMWWKIPASKFLSHNPKLRPSSTMQGKQTKAHLWYANPSFLLQEMSFGVETESLPSTKLGTTPPRSRPSVHAG